MKDSSSTKERFDSIALEYDFMETVYNNNDFFISEMPACRGSILDVGCGSGIMAFELSRYFKKVIGIDISEEMLSIARKKRNAQNISYLNVNASSLDLKEKFDFIVSRNTFHHIEDILETLEKMKTLLNPGGKIAIIDVVSEKQTPHAIHYILGAFMEFAPLAIRIGFSGAIRIFKFRLSKHWLNHLATDRYLSENGFKELFGSCLPECKFKKIHRFHSAVWENPA